MNQQRLRAAFYRGGTSKAVIFRKEDLPSGEPPGNCAEWDRLFLSLMLFALNWKRWRTAMD